MGRLGFTGEWAFHIWTIFGWKVLVLMRWRVNEWPLDFEAKPFKKCAKQAASNKLAWKDEADKAHAGPPGTWNGEPTIPA